MYDCKWVQARDYILSWSTGDGFDAASYFRKRVGWPGMTAVAGTENFAFSSAEIDLFWRMLVDCDTKCGTGWFDAFIEAFPCISLVGRPHYAALFASEI